MSLTEIWLRLMLINSLGSEKALKMIKRLKNYSVINDKILLENGLNTQECQLFNTLSPEQIDVSLNWLEDPTHHLITIADDHYPDSLKSINNPPNAIFAIGNIAILKAYQLAVVGSRHLSDYGERRCREFCEYLAGAGLVITSGLALGIDGVAHRAALNVHTKTIAVLGNGLGSIYPKRHSRLAMDLIDAGGCMISEFPLNTPPLPRNFPWRNRIISGLSIATLVVEATRRSGSLVTARYALEQGRELFAIPGLVDDPRSEGPHWLIQQGAFLVYRPQDVVEYLSSELNWLSILPKVSMLSLIHI